MNACDKTKNRVLIKFQDENDLVLFSNLNKKMLDVQWTIDLKPDKINYPFFISFHITNAPVWTGTIIRKEHIDHYCSIFYDATYDHIFSFTQSNELEKVVDEIYMQNGWN